MDVKPKIGLFNIKQPRKREGGEKVGRLDGKVAIITGAGDGIGRAAALLFAKEGAKVVIADLNAELGEETVKTIKGTGGKATFVRVDVSRSEDVQKMIKVAVDTYGKLDILYNNAGIQGDVVKTADLSEENYDKLMAINLKGVWLGMKYGIPEMIKTGGGAIINTASMSGAIVAMKGAPHYGASKGGVVALSKVTAIEYVNDNIRVNSICPGPTMTALARAYQKAKPKIFSQMEAKMPMGRFGRPEEIAQAALFLASDESSFVTASALIVDGGLVASCLIHLLE